MMPADLIYELRNRKDLPDRCMSFRGYIGHVDANLTVLDFSKSATPLPGYTDRLISRFCKGRGIEGDHTIEFTQFRANLLCEFFSNRCIGPIGFTQKMLYCFAVQAEQIGD